MGLRAWAELHSRRRGRSWRMEELGAARARWGGWDDKHCGSCMRGGIVDSHLGVFFASRCSSLERAVEQHRHTTVGVGPVGGGWEEPCVSIESHEWGAGDWLGQLPLAGAWACAASADRVHA